MTSSFANHIQLMYSINPVSIQMYDYFGNEFAEIPEGWDVDVIVSKGDAIKELRIYRNNLLLFSDWTQLPDTPLTDEQRTEWQVYRQLLRDYPASVDEENWTAPPWPEPPSIQ